MESQPSMTDKPQKVTTVGPIGTALVVLIFLGLIGLNIWQFKNNSDLRVNVENCDLRVQNESLKVDMFMATKNLIINDYWLAKENEFAIETGPALLSATRTALGVVDEVTKKE